MTSAQLDPTATASLATVAYEVGLWAPPPTAYDHRAPSPILLILYFLMINIAKVLELLYWPSLGGRGGGFGLHPPPTNFSTGDPHFGIARHMAMEHDILSYVSPLD